MSRHIAREQSHKGTRARAWHSASLKQIGASKGAVARRPYQPSARRVYPPAAVPEQRSPLGNQSNPPCGHSLVTTCGTSGALLARCRLAEARNDGQLASSSAREEPHGTTLNQRVPGASPASLPVTHLDVP